MKLSNFNFHWTKILYQNNLKYILHSFCTFFKTFNTKENETPRK